MVTQPQTTGVAYGSVRDLDGQLPLLWCSMVVAGRMAVQIGDRFTLNKKVGSGVPKVGCQMFPKERLPSSEGSLEPTQLVSLWTDCPSDHLEYQCLNVWLFWKMSLVPNPNLYVNPCLTLKPASRDADVVIGAVLIPGAKSSKLVTDDRLNKCVPVSSHRCGR